eukprot:6179966-Pleurochrysis_carterae.AAC.3
MMVKAAVQHVRTRSSGPPGGDAAQSSHAPATDPNSPSAMSPGTLRRNLRRARSQRNHAMRQLRKQLQSANEEVDRSALPARNAARSQQEPQQRASTASASAHPQSVRRRRRNAAAQILKLLRLRPTEDMPHVLNRVIQAMSVGVRDCLRALSACQKERFIAQRGFLQQLKNDVFTPKNAWEARLENFWLTRAMERANTVFTKVQRDDGTWARRVLVRLPTAGKKSNRVFGIYRPLSMCRVFAQSTHMKAQLDSVLTPYGELAVGGASYTGVLWDMCRMMSTVINAAHTFENLQPLQLENPALSSRRMQMNFDGMGWTRGHGCTRLILRSLDLKVDFNSFIYARDCMFYIGSDKLKNLSANLRIGDDISIHNMLLFSMSFSR